MWKNRTMTKNLAPKIVVEVKYVNIRLLTLVATQAT